jgi:UDP-N-acetylmuramoylalanine--D-glutamate ligase
MRRASEFQDRKVAVIGAGRAGIAISRALNACGAQVTIYDSKTPEEIGAEAQSLANSGIALTLGQSDYPGIENAEIVVPSPGVRRNAPVLMKALARGATVMGEIEAAYRIAEAPIVAVTGTNGKSTTTAMCAAMLQGAFPNVWFGGNLAPGEPFGSLAMKAGPDDVIVAEVSSFQLEQISSFRPKAGILTNLTPDHFDRHKDMAEYGAAKARLFVNQTPDDFAIVNADYYKMPELNLDATLRAKRCLFRLMRSAKEPDADAFGWVSDGWLRVEMSGRTEKLAPVSAMTVPGDHNVENALAAAMAAWLLQANPDSIRRGLESFQPVDHRMVPVGEADGVKYINNSMCTNPAALVASLYSYAEPVILISGGRNKNLDFQPVGGKIAKRAKAVILIGSAAQEIAAALGPEGPGKTFLAGSLEEAVEQARGIAQSGDVVMLAPGCASMDMFKDFMDRGDQFVRAVKRILGETKDRIGV